MTSCTCHHHTQTEPGSTRCRVDHTSEQAMREDTIRAMEQDPDVVTWCMGNASDEQMRALDAAMLADDDKAMADALRAIRRSEAERTLDRTLSYGFSLRYAYAKATTKLIDMGSARKAA